MFSINWMTDDKNRNTLGLWASSGRKRSRTFSASLMSEAMPRIAVLRNRFGLSVQNRLDAPEARGDLRHR
jgi:hypothetical protein